MCFLCYKFSVSKKNKRKELKQMIEFSGFTEKANSALNSSIKTASSMWGASIYFAVFYPTKAGWQGIFCKNRG